MDINVAFTTNFYIGLGLLVPVFLFGWSLNIRHYRLMRRINFLAPVIVIKKRVAELERYTIRMERIRNILMPLLAAGMMLIFVPQSVYLTELLVSLVLVAVILTASGFYRKYAVQKRNRALKAEIEELEALEK